MKRDLLMLGIGMGSVIMYQQIRNGNMRKIVREMNRTKTKILEDMEEMM